MLGIHPLSVYLLAVGLATLLVAVLVLQSPRSGKTVIVWLLSGVVGILLGSTLPLAACYLANYEITLAKIMPMPEGGAADRTGGPPMEGMGGMPGMGMGSMSMGGPGGPGQTEDANPFQEERNAEALSVLRERFAPGDAPEATVPDPANAENPPAEEQKE